MEDGKQEITINAASQQDVMPLLSLAAGDDVQGLGLEEIVKGCQFFRLENMPGTQMAYALKPVGSELWIQAGAGIATADLTAIGLAVIEKQAAGVFKSVGFQTRRKGLVKKAMRLGYVVDGFILRKVLSA